MNSQNGIMLKLVCEGILSDAATQIPGLSFDRDIKTLTRIVTERGIGVFLLDLPSLDSVLTDGLENGRLSLGSPLTRIYSKRCRVPRLLSGLWLRVFDSMGCLRSSPCPTSIFFLRQVFCLFKRFEVPCSQSRLEKSFREYVHVDSSLREPDLHWRSAHPRDFVVRDDLHLCDRMDDSVSTEFSFGYREVDLYQERQRLLVQRLQRLFDQLSTCVGSYWPPCYSHEVRNRRESHGSTGLRHGPGAVSVKRDAEKYTLSNWPDHLNAAFPHSLMVAKPFGEGGRTTRMSDPSRLISVPKSAKAPRLIAAEPTEHQFCQQLTWRFLREFVDSSFLGKFIDFSRQDLSHKLVLRSSTDRSLVTVDLSSASDRLSVWTIERAFRKNPSLLTALYAHRSKYIKLPNGDLMWLRKFASQGAAVTFPVQSIVFLMAVLAACEVTDVHSDKVDELVGKVRVFGDDIIMPSPFLEDLRMIFDHLQLSINESKSFSKGYFRESCGLDAFMGHCVTPLKVSSLNTTTVSGRNAVLDQTNNSFLKGLWKTSDILRGLLPTKYIAYLPITDLPHTPPALRSFSGQSLKHLTMRWNKRLSRVEFRGVVVSTKEHRSNVLDGVDGMKAFLNERRDPYLSNGYRSSSAVTRTRDGYGWEHFPESKLLLTDRRGVA